MSAFNMIWRWRARPTDSPRFGQRCRVVVRGRMNNCLVEFEDGYRGPCGEWRLALFAPGSTGREALEARGESGQPIAPAVEPGVERASTNGDRCGRRFKLGADYEFECVVASPCPHHGAKETR